MIPLTKWLLCCRTPFCETFLYFVAFTIFASLFEVRSSESDMVTEDRYKVPDKVIVAPVIVGKGHWITFPLEQNNATQIIWSDGGESMSAIYYVDKCWFGSPVKSEGDSAFYSEGLNIEGQTAVFIAAECIEPRFAGGPHMRRSHIVDRMTPDGISFDRKKTCK